MNLYKISIFFFAMVIFGSNSFPQNKEDNYSNINFVHSQKIDKNNIDMTFNNWGLTYKPYSQSGGFWEIAGEQNSRGIVFDQAPWIVGKRNGEIVLSGGQWYSAYSPGPIINGQAGMLIHPEDSLKYRVYKINKGDNNTNPDYAEWPVDFGAPVNTQGEPQVYGDQTLWTSFNYLDSNLTYPFNPFDNIDPLELEIHQTVFAREGNESDLQNIFANVIFLEYEIIYKGNDPIDSAYFGFWTDIDFEPTYNNRPAIDVSLETGYCWTSTDTTYEGYIPVAVGYTFLFGPVVPEIGDEAIFKGKVLNGYKNLNLSASKIINDEWSFIGDSIDAAINSLPTAWNYSNGLNANGNRYIDPTTNQPTTFPFSGDPVTGSGWIFSEPGTAGEAGVMLFAGPFTLAPNDTQWTMLALVPGLGSSNLNSITAMREKVQILRSLPYDSLAFGTTNYFITDVDEIGNVVPEKFSLSQNYPNPFNPSTTIKYSLPNVTLSPNKIGINSAEGSRVQLKIYDVLGKEIATLVNEEKPAGNYEVDFNASSLSSGVYFYTLRAGSFVQTKKMILIK